MGVPPKELSPLSFFCSSTLMGSFNCCLMVHLVGDVFVPCKIHLSPCY